jgi:hypothetical protein
MLCFLPISIFGRTAEFERQHSFRAGDTDSRVSARNTATQEAQTLLLRELGVLVESRQSLKTTNEKEDFSEEVQIYTLGRVNTEVLRETWDGETFSATFRMVVDTAALFIHLENVVNIRQQARTDSLALVRRGQADSIALVRQAQADSISLIHRARADSISLEQQIRARQAGLASNINEPKTTTATNRQIQGNRHFVFSLRPELVAGTSVMGAGGTVELGVIGANGFYFSTELNGGGVYYGGALNFGKCLNRDGLLKNAVGVSAGYHNTLLFVNFIKENETLKSQTGTNIGIVGIFWKLMFGEEKNIDITNRILFGWKKNPGFYNSENEKIVFEEGINTTWTIGIGYTLTRKRK